MVSTDCPHGPAEILENGEVGVLVPPGDAAALAVGSLRVLYEPELRAQLVARGWVRSQQFRADAIARQYADLFRQVLQPLT